MRQSFKNTEKKVANEKISSINDHRNASGSVSTRTARGTR